MPGLSRFINRSENPHDIDAILCGSTALTSIENAIYEVIDLFLEQTIERKGSCRPDIYDCHLSVDIGIELQFRIQTGAAFGSEKLNGALRLFQVQTETGFY